MNATPEELKKDKELYHNLKTLTDTEGGKILVDNLVKDVISTMHVLANSYKTGKEVELRSECAKLQSILALLGILVNAKKNEEDIDGLIEEALRA